MKLELKHLAGYLPYGLNAQDLRTKEVRTVTLLNFTYDLQTVGHNHLLYDGLMLSKHLPILRPLSDLTKEIEVNGEKFVPKSTLFRLFGDMTQFQILEKGFYSLNYGYYLKIEQLPHNIVSQLLEWHFDIYGLIEKGLAIDINTLKND